MRLRCPARVERCASVARRPSLRLVARVLVVQAGSVACVLCAWRSRQSERRVLPISSAVKTALACDRLRDPRDHACPAIVCWCLSEVA